MSLEQTLPKELGFDYALDDDGTMHDVMDQIIDEKRDILDPEFEFKSTELLAIVYKSSHSFATELGIGSDEDEGRAAIYRSMCFANQLAGFASARPAFKVNFGEYINELAESGDAGGKLRDDAQQYLQDRPHVDAFIGYYVHMIDLTGERWLHDVETVTAVMLMLAERGIASAQIEDEIDQLDMDKLR